MTIEQRVAVLEEIFVKLQDYYTSAYSGEEIDARLASAGVPIGITKEYKSVTEMNQDFTGTDVQRGQFVLILPDSTASADYGKVYLKGTANWVYAFTLTTLTSIKGPIGPPGKKGDQGDPGEAGSSFAILGYFDTLDDLKAAAPNPTAGDVYGVGTAPPYNIYIWDPANGKWVGNGNLQGPQGEQGIQGPEGKRGPEGKQGPEGPVGGSSNFVRYDEAQSLTDEQKAQARTNIDAAPGGFGLGGNIVYAPINSDGVPDANLIDATGFYLAQANVGPEGWHYIFHMQYPSSAGDALQFGSFVNNTSYKFRKEINGIWQPWEYVNPPMNLDTEYRTTERYMGKPVYKKLVTTGALPSATGTVEYFPFGTDYNAGDYTVFSVECYIANNSDGKGWQITIPKFSNGSLDISMAFSGKRIDIYVNGDWSLYYGFALLKYTKTTD